MTPKLLLILIRPNKGIYEDVNRPSLIVTIQECF